MRGWLAEPLAIVYGDVISNLSLPSQLNKTAKNNRSHGWRDILRVLPLHPKNKEDDTRENLDLPWLQSTPARGLRHLCPRLEVIKCTLNFEKHHQVS